MEKMQNILSFWLPYFLRLCVPVIYMSRLQSKIATGKRSLSHRVFSLTASRVSERVSSMFDSCQALGLFRGDGAFGSASYFRKYREKHDCNRFFVYANLSGVNSYD